MLRTKVLDAAEKLILEKGTDALRVEDVAALAGVSKGGLLHHFRSKHALIEGVLRRQVDTFEKVLPPEGAPPGAFTMAWLAAAVPESEPEAGGQRDQVSVALLSAISGGDETLEILREKYTEWQRRLASDGLDPTVATLVRFAADGWWTSRILKLAQPTENLYLDLRRTLVEMIETAAGKE
ncbi:TetR/AcrR family transcriptional regulator [Amycolatopsis sp. NPDC051102]|uniref:TetR/AcrR family transcriptional regulator n=1 Tax=Amycolatopsis sp. NPDC051102 TaxID=3155163 RepID=UPI00341C7BD5